jgi:hypothetical protein
MKNCFVVYYMPINVGDCELAHRYGDIFMSISSMGITIEAHFEY